jgi:hypothetical protein
MDLATDRLVLIAEPGVEVLVALLLLLIGLLAAFVSTVMALRGRVEGWSLVGVFGLVAIGAVVMLAHMPTRLVFDRQGAEVAYWHWQSRRAWPEFSTVNIQRGWGGLFVRFTPRDGAGRILPWSQWPGLFVRETPLEPRQVSMRIDAWRMGGAK